ncbi:MAG TPA: hypothetical protein VFH51_08505 [Myxococcota bacterium]|nr:hypothetical protein [Myxococcota bacterium]
MGRIPQLVTWGLAVAFGVASLWVVSEQDIFWQIRAGDDLVRTHMFPDVDTWSFSSPGARWMNIQWLSTLLFRCAYGLGTDTALIVLRGALVTGLFCLVGDVIARSLPVALSPLRRALWHAVLLPAIYVILSPRIQLRSDFLVLIVFAVLVRTWLGRAPAGAKRRRSVALVGLAANLHAGTAPFVALAALAFVAAEERPWVDAAPWYAIITLALAATPYGVAVLPLLWAHVRYAQHNILPNPDHTPFDEAYLMAFTRGNFAGVLWVAVAAGTVLALAWIWRRRAGLPGGYGPSLALLGATLLLVVMSLDRVRAIPYHTLFVLPVVARGLGAWEPDPWISTGLVGGSGAAFGLFVTAMLPLWGLRPGLRLDRDLFPVGSTRFIQATHPQPNILHTFAYGAYTVWHLRDYPVYVDTRETLYWHLQPEILAAYHSPEITQALCEKYGINTVLMPIAKTRYLPGLGFEDVLATYLPHDAWALVHFDDISVVMLRRIPLHAGIIAAHEYEVLRPNLPANTYPLTGRRGPERDARFVAEITRCLAEEPDNAFCQLAQASFWRATDATRKADALALLQRAARRISPQSPQYLTLQVELQHAYRANGMLAEALAIDEALGPAATMRTPPDAPLPAGAHQ